MHTRRAKRKTTAKPSRSALEARAEALGIRFNDRWSDEALVRNIRKKETEK